MLAAQARELPSHSCAAKDTDRLQAGLAVIRIKMRSRPEQQYGNQSEFGVGSSPLRRRCILFLFQQNFNVILHVERTRTHVSLEGFSLVIDKKFCCERCQQNATVRSLDRIGNQSLDNLARQGKENAIVPQ
jgi:hypothetical protein